VKQEPAQEFVGGEGHLALLVAVGVVPPEESNLAVLEGDQPMVGDGHAMGITGQIVQDIFRTAEGRLGIDHPILTVQGTDQGAKQLGASKCLLVSIKPQFPLLESPAQAGHKFAPKDAAEDFHRQEEGIGGMNPAGVIGGQTARRNHAVDMGVVPLAPRIP